MLQYLISSHNPFYGVTTSRVFLPSSSSTRTCPSVLYGFNTNVVFVPVTPGIHANLDATIGSEQTGVRPVIIIQNNIGNKYSPTTIVVPLTKEIRFKMNQPTHYFLSSFGNIKFDSIILAEQIRAIDKNRLEEKIGIINRKTMREIEQKILVALGIEKF